MKLLSHNNVLLRNSEGKILKIRPDTYVEPIPELFMFEVSVNDNQTVTLPTPNMSTGINYTRISLYHTDKTTFITSGYTTSSSPTSYLLNSGSLTGNTEYYVKVSQYYDSTSDPYYQFNSSYSYLKYFNIQITGATAIGGLAPTEEEEYQSITINGGVIENQYLQVLGEVWYKFKTNSSGTCHIRIDRIDPYNTSFYNYNVDWGDGGYTSNILTYDSVDRQHTYEKKGNYVIRVSGTMKGFSIENTADIKLLITKVISWGDVGFEKLNFRGCTALTTLPNQLNKLTTVKSFNSIFYDCTSLSFIPYGIFFGNDVAIDYSYSFYNCKSLMSIPSTTFSTNEKIILINHAFRYCDKLRTLPSKMFENCPNIINFSYCFENCTMLDNLPDDVFYRSASEYDYNSIAKSNMDYIFSMCHGLTLLPQSLFSSPQIDDNGINNIKGSSFVAAFYNCTGLTEIPSYFYHNQIYATTLNSTFYDCRNVVTVGDSCFEGCTSALSIAGTYVYSSSRYGVFGACTSLVTVGQNLFKDCISLTDVSYCFSGCANLQYVGNDIFKNCVSVLSYASIFNSCIKLETLPPNIFHDSPAVTNISYAFYGTRLHSGDNYVNYQIPENMFENNNMVINFAGLFANNTNIITIPENIFSYCPNVEIFSDLFYRCYNFSEIPPKLFRYNPNVRYFNTTFSDTNVSYIPTIIENEQEYGLFYFNTLTQSFVYTFRNCKLQNIEGRDAIPSITFLGNSEVFGIIITSISINTSGSFYGTFEGNTLLQSIPDYLFVNNSKAADFTRTFYYCNNPEFISLPPNLFSGNANAERFYQTFYGVKLKTIPETLFKNCVRATTFNECFRLTDIESIPSGLFGNALGEGPRASLQTLEHTFSYCYKLTSIGADLFKYNINIISFRYCFTQCTSLIEIPQDLFKLAEGTSIANDFSYIFDGCINLKDVKTNIFRYNIGALNFSYSFRNCHKLKQEPTMFYDLSEKSTRFLNKSMNFTFCFNRTLMDALDLIIELYDSYNGSLIASNDDSGGFYQPLLSRSLAQNTEYYYKVRVKNENDSGYYNILITGGTNMAEPIPDPNATNIYVNTLIENEYISGSEEKWYKFKTSSGSTYNYVIRTFINSGEQLLRRGTAPDLWNCTYTIPPTKTGCWGGVGNSVDSLTNYNTIPSDWK